jgi:hypothetical protein
MKPWHNGLGVGGLFIASGVSLFLGADPAPKSKKPEPAAVNWLPAAAPAKPAAATKMQPLNKQETVLLDLDYF